MSEQKYDETNRGAIFKNDYKQKDTQPDYKGKINVDGVEKAISLWVKEDKSGKKFFSASISKPYQSNSGPSKTDEDDTPF
jgi:hypothetical protein